MELVTTNIRLEKGFYRWLKERAFAEGKSIAQLIRDALGKVYKPAREHPIRAKLFRRRLTRIVNLGSGSRTNARGHDEIYSRH